MGAKERALKSKRASQANQGILHEPDMEAARPTGVELPQKLDSTANLHHEVALPDFPAAHEHELERGTLRLVQEEMTEIPAGLGYEYSISADLLEHLSEFNPFLFSENPNYFREHPPPPVYPAAADTQPLSAFPNIPSSDPTTLGSSPQVQPTELHELHASPKTIQRVRSGKRRADPVKDKQAQDRFRDKKAEALHMLSDEYAELSVAYRTYLETRLPAQYRKKEPDVSKHWRNGPQTYSSADTDARASLAVRDLNRLLTYYPHLLHFLRTLGDLDVAVATQQGSSNIDVQAAASEMEEGSGPSGSTKILGLETYSEAQP